MNDSPPPTESQAPLSQEQRLDRLYDAFALACRSGKAPRIEDYLDEMAGMPREFVLGELLITELEERQAAGQSPHRDDYLVRFPEDADTIDAAFQRLTDRSRAGDARTRSPRDTGESAPIASRRNASTGLRLAAIPTARKQDGAIERGERAVQAKADPQRAVGPAERGGGGLLRRVK